MPKSVKTRNPMSVRSKGLICLVLLLALTVFVSCISLAGMNLDAEGVNILLPWVPVSGANWPASLPLNRALGGGAYYDYAVSLPEGSEADLNTEAQTALKVIEKRIETLRENDGKATLKDGVIRLEIGNMDASTAAGMIEWMIKPGKFTFASGETTLLTEKEIAAATMELNASRNGYNLVLTANDEGAKALADAGAYYVSIACDGETVSSYATVSGNKITASLGSSQSGYSMGSNMLFLLNTGAVDVTLTQAGSGTVDATAASVKTIVLIVGAMLLVCALAYLVFVGKLTGVAGFLTVWCAVMLILFFVATIVAPTPSVVGLSAGCLAAVLLGILLAIYTAVTRTDAIAKQISEGSAPRQAAKFGFRAAAKNVWLAHGGVLVIALLLMIFPFSQAIGYSLAAGVAGSAITAFLMRVYLACFITVNGKASLYGKAK